jgi:membrane-bound lytic murein transglycosylase B
MHRAFLKFFEISLLSLSLALAPAFALAQTATPTSADATKAAQQAALQQQLNDILAQISQQQQALSSEQQKGQTLQRDINILDDQIKEAQLQIKAHQLKIQQLGTQIDQKSQTIADLNERISATDQSLGQLVRQTNQLDSYSLADVVLSGRSISDFFADLDTFDTLKQSIQVSLSSIRKTQSDTQTAKQNLTERQVEERDAKQAIQEEQAQIKAKETQKAALLSLSKKQQSNYSSVIAQQQAKANAIRQALFSLLQSNTQITFGVALQYAKEAQKLTGVDPAFLLAILTQETNLGKNVGTCNKAGQPAYKLWQSIMSKSNQPAYIQITSALGLDPASQPLSCPQSSGGYGGAMGPAQFIPSTWLLIQPKINAALGTTGMPNPWDPKTAFLAAALYLRDIGAAGGTYSAKRNAACRYYSGRACDTKKPPNSSYGNSVMALASSIQLNQINPLESAGGV